MVLPIARARGNSRTDEKSRALAPRQSDDRELPSAGVRLLSFTLSLSVSYRKNEEVRCAFCVFVFSYPSSFRAHGSSIPIHSFHVISFHSDRVLRPRVRRSWAHIREKTPFAIRALRRGGVVGCGTDANARGSIGLGETLTDGWMDPDPGGDRDCFVRVMRRRRVRDRGDGGRCVVVRSFFLVDAIGSGGLRGGFGFYRRTYETRLTDWTRGFFFGDASRS